MKITSVSYQRLKSLPGYENRRIGADATVEHGETPEKALEHLTDWVETELDLDDRLIERRGSLRRELHELSAAVALKQLESEALGKVWEKQKRFLQHLGLEIPAGKLPDEDIPF